MRPVSFPLHFLNVGVGGQGTSGYLVRRICKISMDILRIDQYNNHVQPMWARDPLLSTSAAYALRCTFLPYCSPHFICHFPIPFPCIFQSPSFLYLTHALRHLGKTCPLAILCSFVNGRRTPVPSHPFSWEPGANEARFTVAVPVLLSRGTKLQSAPPRPPHYIPLTTPRGDQKGLFFAVSARNINPMCVTVYPFTRTIENATSNVDQPRYFIHSCLAYKNTVPMLAVRCPSFQEGTT
jgi:hypothetical protein